MFFFFIFWHVSQDPPTVFKASNTAAFPYDVASDAKPVAGSVDIDATTSGAKKVTIICNKIICNYKYF
jgi:hypothetical protein